MIAVAMTLIGYKTAEAPRLAFGRPRRHPADPGVLNTPAKPLFVTLGGLDAGLSFTFYVNGLHHTATAVASIVAMVEPVTASLFGVVVLSKSLLSIQIAGMVLILATVTALSVYSSPKE